jgi:uncharacterized protein
MAERRVVNPGNFAEDRERASRAGHLGGQHSSGNFAHDRERAVQAGRKGGQASHGSRQSEKAGPSAASPVIAGSENDAAAPGGMHSAGSGRGPATRKGGKPAQ